MLTIALEDPLSPEARMLIDASQKALEAVYPPEEIFSFSAHELARPGTRFFIAREDSAPLGCVALVAQEGYGEVKRLFTLPAARGKGVARALMAALEDAAVAQSLPAIRLETGRELDAALRLYRALEYTDCPPFGGYPVLENNLFLEKRLPVPRRAGSAGNWGAVLALLRAEFASMEGRINPPSSLHRLNEAAIAEQARTGEVWLIEDTTGLLACAFFTPKPQALYIGKLAVAAHARGRGLARRLIDTAAARARALGLPALELQSRIELYENHALFRHLGFSMRDATAHPGHDRPTSCTFTRPL